MKRTLSLIAVFVCLFSSMHSQQIVSKEMYSQLYLEKSGYLHLQRTRYLMGYEDPMLVYHEDLIPWIRQGETFRYQKAIEEGLLALERPAGLNAPQLSEARRVTAEAYFRLSKILAQDAFAEGKDPLKSEAKSLLDLSVAMLDEGLKHDPDNVFIRDKVYYHQQLGLIWQALAILEYYKNTDLTDIYQIYKTAGDLWILVGDEAKASLWYERWIDVLKRKKADLSTNGRDLIFRLNYYYKKYKHPNNLPVEWKIDAATIVY